MRAVWKFSVILLTAVCAQWFVQRGASQLDEAQFAVRAYLAHLQGQSPDDPRLLNAALDLHQRQCARWVREQRAMGRRAADYIDPRDLELLCLEAGGPSAAESCPDHPFGPRGPLASIAATVPLPERFD